MKKYTKAVIVALALSMTLCGGQVLAGNGHGPGDGTGEGDGTGGYGPGDCLPFTNPDSSIIIAGYDDDNGKGDQDKTRDDTCLPATNPDSSIIIAGYDDDNGKGDQDKTRDDTCLDA